MSTGPLHLLQKDLQNELTTSNQLLKLIFDELQQIIQFTNPGGAFESNIMKNVSLMTTLATMQKVNIENLPPMPRTNISNDNDPTMACE